MKGKFAEFLFIKRQENTDGTADYFGGADPEDAVDPDGPAVTIARYQLIGLIQAKPCIELKELGPQRQPRHREGSK